MPKSETETIVITVTATPELIERLREVLVEPEVKMARQVPVVERWLTEGCSLEARSHVTTAALERHYRQWCILNGLAEARQVSLRSLLGEIREVNLPGVNARTDNRRKVGGRLVAHVSGLALRPLV